MRFVLLSLACLALLGCKEEDKGLLTSPAGHKFAFLQRPDANIVAIQVAFPMDWALQHNPAVPTIAAEVMTTGGRRGLPSRRRLGKLSGYGRAGVSIS